MRYFNTSGPNFTKEHYTLERNGLIDKGLDLVKRNRYFTIWAPRQTGKSTFFELLATHLKTLDYKVLQLNVENYKTTPETNFLHDFMQDIKRSWKHTFQLSCMSDFSNQIKNITDEKFILIIDEIENLNPDYVNQFLHTIRHLYHSRTQHALKSVILVGVSNILGIIQDNASPFNIADNLDVPFFTKEEVYELLAQHETETNQLFDNEVKEKIYDITAGQPGLVNGFAYQLVERYKNKKLIQTADFLEVEDWYLRKAIDKNVENVKNKAKQHRKFIETLLFEDKEIRFDIDKETIKFLHVNGIITEDQNKNVCFWVPLYKKKLYNAFYPYMNGEKDAVVETIILKRFLNPDGSVSIDYLLNKYKEYITKRSFKPYREKDKDGNFVSIPEAAMIYSFETYIDAIISAFEGKTYREADAGLGKSDLIINLKGKEYLFETKKYYSEPQYLKGKQQLAYYCKKLGLKEGIYLIFLSNRIEYPEEVQEETFIVDDVLIRCYLVYYDIEKDF